MILKQIFDIRPRFVRHVTIIVTVFWQMNFCLTWPWPAFPVCGLFIYFYFSFFSGLFWFNTRQRDWLVATFLHTLWRHCQIVHPLRIDTELPLHTCYLWQHELTFSFSIACWFFPQLPNIISHLEKLASVTSGLSGGGSTSVYNAVIHLLTYIPLLDVVDTKCKSVRLCFLVNPCVGSGAL